MEKSALQIARAAYQPKLPKALQGPVTLMECLLLHSRQVRLRNFLLST